MRDIFDLILREEVIKIEQEKKLINKNRTGSINKIKPNRDHSVLVFNEYKSHILYDLSVSNINGSMIKGLVYSQTKVNTFIKNLLKLIASYDGYLFMYGSSQEEIDELYKENEGEIMCSPANFDWFKEDHVVKISDYDHVTNTVLFRTTKIKNIMSDDYDWDYNFTLNLNRLEHMIEIVNIDYNNISEYYEKYKYKGKDTIIVDASRTEKEIDEYAKVVSTHFLTTLYLLILTAQVFFMKNSGIVEDFHIDKYYNEKLNQYNYSIGTTDDNMYNILNISTDIHDKFMEYYTYLAENIHEEDIVEYEEFKNP